MIHGSVQPFDEVCAGGPGRIINHRRRELEEALLAVADMIEADPVYIPIFERLDAELTAETGGISAVLARARMKIRGNA